jgi:diguanylate cyclase (GGDEF)-like protein/PAS domain S-box-containing protein
MDTKHTPAALAHRPIGAVAVAAAAQFLATGVGIGLALPDTGESLLWPASGVALALTWLFGLRALAGIFIGATVATALWAGVGAAAAAVIAAGATGGAALGFAVLRRAGFDARVSRVRDVIVLCLLAGPAGALLAGLAGPFALWSTGQASGWPPAPSALGWWLGNALGVVVFAPAVFTLRSGTRWPGTHSPWQGAMLVAGTAASLWLTFSGVLTSVIGEPFAYLTLPLLVWIGLTAGMRTAAATIVLVAGFAWWGLFAGTSPLASGAPFTQYLMTHLYVAASALMTMLLCSLAAERRAASAELRAVADRFRSLTSLSADWYWEQDADMRFTLIAGRAVDENRLQADAILGRTRWELPGEVPAEARRRHDEAWARREPFHDVVMTRIDAQGSLVTVSVSGEPVFGAGGRFLGYRGVARDITAQIRAEREIDDSRRYLDAMVDAIPSPVLVKDAAHRYIAANTAFCQFFRRSLEDVRGRTDFDFFPADQARFFQETDDRALQGEAVHYERLYTIDGQGIWMWTRKTSLTRPDGSRVVLLLMTDVTARRAAEEALKASEQRFRHLAQLSADWYWEQDEQCRFTFFSDSGLEKLAIPATEMLGRTRFELDLEWESEAAREAHRRTLEAHAPFRDLVVRSRHSGRTTLVAGEPVFDATGRFTGYRGVGRDITAMKQAEGEIAESRTFLYAVVDALPTPFTVKDRQHRYVLANEAFCKVVGRSREELLGKDDRSVLPPEQAAEVWRTDDAVLVGGEPLEYEGPFRTGATELYTLVRKSALTRADGSRVVLSSIVDISRQKAVEAQLRLSERRFRDFADAASEFVWETDAHGAIAFVSSRVSTVLGYGQEELIGRRPQNLMPPGEYERIVEWIREHRRNDGSFHDLEHRYLTKAGQLTWIQASAVQIVDEHGAFAGYRGTARDITDRKTAEERISYLATRDPLTDLPNRVLFNDRLEQGLVNARRKRDQLALMFIDLDRFKNINDSLGHQVGDLLLKEVAARMQACIRKGDTLSRLGGDEFVVTLEGLQQAEDAAQVAQKIIAALAQPMTIAGHILTTSCSIGISIFPADAEDSSALMKNADTAMYHAKEKGRRNFQFFSREMNIRAVERHNLETSLRVALDRDEFVLFYQPQVDIATGRVVGVEALLRWRHPAKGLLPPSMFIDVAEETGLIDAIGQWTLRAACTQNKAWQDAGYPHLRIAVNISARQFNQPREFSRSVSRILSSTGLDPGWLELEMTESVLLEHADENIQVLRRLGKLGTRIAVDDFGTGYSSLSYLKQLPIHSLKIDRSFVRDLESEKDSEVIVNTIIAMGHTLRLRVTAEGVDNLAQLSALKRLGCDEYQGFLFSRPLGADDFARRFLAPRELNFGS